MSEIKAFKNMEITTVGGMISTVITLENGQKVRLLSDEKAIARLILAYRRALTELRQGKAEKDSQ